MAHRLSILRDQDETLVPEQGCLVQRGCQAEFLAQLGSAFHLQLLFDDRRWRIRENHGPLVGKVVVEV